MKAITFSHKGKRKTNQDLILEETFDDKFYLLAVIDGMGGYDHGDVAAKIIAESITTYLSTVDKIDDFHIQKAVNKANLAIRQKNEMVLGHMGATIGGVIIHDSAAICFWIGDVKIFHFRKNNLIFESFSHNLVNNLIESGTITEPSRLLKYRHFVTRSIHGDVQSSKTETHFISNLDASDMILVCSDGVHDLYEGLQLERMLANSENEEDLTLQLTNHLIKEATDNFSFCILSIS